MLLAERRLVCDVEHRYRALLAVCELGRATGEELLGAIQQDVFGGSIKEIL